jgi:hypothetical protein
LSNAVEVSIPSFLKRRRSMRLDSDEAPSPWESPHSFPGAERGNSTPGQHTEHTMEWLIGGLVVAYLLSNSNKDDSTDARDAWQPHRANSSSSELDDEQDDDDEADLDEHQDDDEWDEHDESNSDDDDWEGESDDLEDPDSEREYDPIAIEHLCTDVPVIACALAVQPESSELLEFVSSRFAVGDDEWDMPQPRPSDWIWERAIDSNIPSNEAVRQVS